MSPSLTKIIKLQKRPWDDFGIYGICPSIAASIWKKLLSQVKWGIFSNIQKLCEVFFQKSAVLIGFFRVNEARKLPKKFSPSEVKIDKDYTTLYRQ